MATITFTADDGTVTEYHDQAYTDAALAAAQPTVALEATEVDLLMTDGTTKKFVPAA